jgi:uncharacterized protein (TIGR03066 family)
MTVLRVALAGCLLLAVAGLGLAGAGKKIDKDKLISTWTFVKTDDPKPPPPGTVIKIEFTKDGKVNMSTTFKKKTTKMTGTYTLNGDRVTTVFKGPGGKEEKDNATIVELTDRRLVVTTKSGGRTEKSEYKK